MDGQGTDGRMDRLSPGGACFTVPKNGFDHKTPIFAFFLPTTGHCNNVVIMQESDEPESIVIVCKEGPETVQDKCR